MLDILRRAEGFSRYKVSRNLGGVSDQLELKQGTMRNRSSTSQLSGS